MRSIEEWRGPCDNVATDNESRTMTKVKIGRASLYNMDCMEYLRSCPDKCFDLAIVDPPYGIGENGDRNKSRSKMGVAKDYKAFAGGDASPPDREYFEELRRVSKNQIIWGANHFIQNVPYGSPCWIVWDKMTGESDFADCELAYTSFPTAVRKFKFQWSGMLQGDRRNKEHRIHPTQKPVKLYEWLLLNYAKPGQRILDTHLGSGSHAIAANGLGFDFVGLELDPHYFEASCERIALAAAQCQLFAPEPAAKAEQVSMF